MKSNLHIRTVLVACCWQIIKLCLLFLNGMKGGRKRTSHIGPPGASLASLLCRCPHPRHRSLVVCHGGEL